MSFKLHFLNIIAYFKKDLYEVINNFFERFSILTNP